MNKRKKQNPDKMDFIKIKNFYSAKDPVKKIKRLHTICQ